MVVEYFKPNCFDKVYLRFQAKGRMIPDGLHYIDSWINQNQNICFQLMETNNEELFKVWTDNWKDLIDFEITPID